jgi:hypothetical protein
MTNVNNSLLNQGINETKNFIEHLKVSIEKKESLDEQQSIRIRSRIDGALTLLPEDIEKEDRTLSILHDAVKGKVGEKWSREGVDHFLQDAVFHSLDIAQKSPESFDKRLETALQTLKESLVQPLKPWKFYHVVLGLDVSDANRNIGKVEFFHGSPEILEQILLQINDITDESLNTAEEKESLKGIYEEQVRRFFEGVAIAGLTVTAGDLEAARRLVHEELQTTLDVINFYTLSVYSQNLRVRVFLPGDAIGTQSLNISFREDEGFNIQRPRHGPLVNFSLSSINEHRAKSIGLTRLSEILSKPAPNDIEKRLLAAVRIAGKAVSSIRREDAFLLHAIALESVLVGGKEITDLTYKLSTRCAHLLGTDLEKRKIIKKEVAGLYGIRSAIVHRGENNFTDSDFFRIRSYTQNVLVSLLTKDELKDFTKKEELNYWFDERMLS